MSGHTPGPWVAQQDPNGSRDDWCIGIEGAPIDYVATCSKRDARLIAAAPELLQALQDAVTSTDYDMAPPHPWVKDARAAIAKATGETE